jgi:hypothetical protein
LPLPFALGISPDGTPGLCLALAAFVFCLTGELLERYLFFTAVAPVKMPGGLVA